MKTLRVFLVVVLSSVAGVSLATDWESVEGGVTGSYLSASLETLPLDISVKNGEGRSLIEGVLNKDAEMTGSFAVMKGKTGLKQGNGVRVNYAVAPKIPISASGETTIAPGAEIGMGQVSGSYRSNGWTKFMFDQVLFGIRPSLKIESGKSSPKMFAEKTFEKQSDDYGSEPWLWDSYGYGLSFKTETNNGPSALLTQGKLMKKHYNPSLYFFTEDWVTDVDLRAETREKLSSVFQLFQSAGYFSQDVERDGQIDVERLEFAGGLRVVLSSSTAFSLRAAYAPYLNDRGHETLLSGAMDWKKYRIEVFQRDIVAKYSSFEEKEGIFGVNLAWKFGGAVAAEDKKVRGMEDYNGASKMRFYASDVRDDHQLSLSQESEYLSSLSRRNAWSGEYLKYITASGYQFRTPDQVFSGRGGDCDEQACLNTRMDTSNGYKAKTFFWGDWQYAHAASVVQDRNGQWFLDEYGMLYKVKVDPNADIKNVVLEALRQNIAYTALANDPQYVYTHSCDGWLADDYVADGIGARQASHRPEIEFGHELFTTRNFLFGD
ncbi:MAG: hypothetical protein PHD04_05330 [Candidatus Pacebacteria bacterium]|nr:hypothetical protein [Candidatus Paceibacterota bacterium]